MTKFVIHYNYLDFPVNAQTLVFKLASVVQWAYQALQNPYVKKYCIIGRYTQKNNKKNNLNKY